MKSQNIRIECRKCGAILPGPVEVCPICYAEQNIREDEERKGGYKVFLLAGFFVLVAALLGYLIYQT